MREYAETCQRWLYQEQEAIPKSGMEKNIEIIADLYVNKVSSFLFSPDSHGKLDNKVQKNNRRCCGLKYLCSCFPQTPKVS